MRRITVALFLLAAIALLGAAGATAGKPDAMVPKAGKPKRPVSTFLPAPAFPQSTLAINVVGRPRGGRLVTLVVSGSNAPNEINPGVYTPYTLDVFVQNGRVLPDCPRSYHDELDNLINLGVSRVLSNSNEGDFGAFQIPVRFLSLRNVRNLVACAYTTSIIDDVAVSRLQFKLRKPKKRK
jgi:hypothetical protein